MPPLIIEPEALQPLLAAKHLLIVDLCRPEIYAQGHLPGAIQVLPQELISGVKPAVGKLPTCEQLQALFSRIGYTPDQHIVVYDDEGGGWAGRFIWTLDVIGHQATSYLNGGLHAWLAAGLPTSDAVPNVQPTEVALSVHRDIIADKQEILATLADPNVVIWDARGADEYLGTKIVSLRGGRIPGAINFEWTEAMDQERQFRIRHGLAERLNQLGMTQDKQIITHCQTHHRSGFTYLVGKSLGYRIKAYDGSWSEWGNDPDTPIESG